MPKLTDVGGVLIEFHQEDGVEYQVEAESFQSAEAIKLPCPICSFYGKPSHDLIIRRNQNPFLGTSVDDISIEDPALIRSALHAHFYISVDVGQVDCSLPVF